MPRRRDGASWVLSRRQGCSDGTEHDHSAEGAAVHLPRVAACGSKPSKGGPVAPPALRNSAEASQSHFVRGAQALSESKLARPVELSASDQQETSVARSSQPEHLLAAPTAPVPELVRLRRIVEQKRREPADGIDRPSALRATKVARAGGCHGAPLTPARCEGYAEDGRASSRDQLRSPKQPETAATSRATMAVKMDTRVMASITPANPSRFLPSPPNTSRSVTQDPPAYHRRGAILA